MQRRSLFLLSALTVALSGVGGRAALAERLGGAYRGPEDVQTAKETNQQSGTDATGPEGGGRDSSGGGDSGGGIGSGGDSGGGSSGGGGDSGGGSTTPPSGGDSGGGGGGNIGGGGDSSGSTARSSGGTDKKSGGAGGPGAGKGRAGGADPAQEQLMVVSWYFEHNREKLMSEVAEARTRRIRPGKGSVPAVLSLVPRDTRDRIFDLLAKNTLASEDVVRDAVVIALGKIGTPAAVETLRKRLDEESKWDIKEDILLALGIARTKEAVDALDATLKSNRTRLHAFALLGLGLTQDERAAQIVLDHFQADLKRAKQVENDVSAAAMALGALRYEKAEPALVSAMKSKTVPDVAKVYVAQALGRLGTDGARKALEAALDGTEDVARAALLALANFPDSAVAKTLAGKEGLGRPDPLGAGFAALSLGKVLSGLPDADWKKMPDDLRDIALSPQRGSVKAQYANLALAFFDGGLDGDVRRRYAEELRSGSKLPPDVVSAMAMACGVGSVTGMEGSLRSIAEGSGFDPKLRGYAALSLGMTGDPSTTAQMLRTVYGSSDNADVQRGAVLGLGLVGDRRDVPFLLDVIVKTDRNRPFAGYTRGAAVMALGMIRDGESIAKIQDLLRNPDPWVRAYAIAALGYLADKDPAPVLPTLFEHTNFRQEFLPLKIAMRTL
jgi:HEAT repeat protein